MNWIRKLFHKHRWYLKFIETYKGRDGNLYHEYIKICLTCKEERRLTAGPPNE